MLNTLFGSISDTFFSSIGASPYQVRHRGIVIAPTPLVSYEGVQGLAEPSRLTQSESASTFTVSIPKEVLTANLGDLAEKAIKPNQPWELSTDDGAWLQCRTLGDPENETFRVKLMLVSVKP
jgi:hypothetical protein